MKKVALSLLAFALVGGAAFADATADVVKNPVTATLNVSATGKFGFDLDTKNHSFGNENTGKLTLWFLNGTSAKTGEGDVHGYISAADIKLGFDDSTNFNNLVSADSNVKSADGTAAKTTPAVAFGDITAKIVAYDLYVKIYTNVDPSADYAADGDNDNSGATTAHDDTFYKYTTKYGATSAEWTTGNASALSAFGGTGVEVGYTFPKVVTLIGQVASNGNGAWADDTQVGYEGSFGFELLAVDKLTLKSKFYTAKSTDVYNAAGVEAAYDFGVAIPYTHTNYNLTDNFYSADVGAKLPLVDGLLVDGVVLANNSKASKDAILGYTLTATLAQSKLAGPLGLDVGFRQPSLKAANYELFAKVGLKLTDVVSATGTADYYIADGSTDASLFAKAQVEYTGISLTTIGLYWDSSDLGALKSTGNSKLGLLAVKAKIAY